MNFQVVSQILSGVWQLEPRWAQAHLPIVISMLKGQTLDFVQRSGNKGIEGAFAINAKTGNRQELQVFDQRTWTYVLNPALESGSIGVIPISDAITKYNVECGAPGMIQRDNWLRDFINNDLFSSIILLIDTPGGEARAADTFVQTMQSSQKPIISYIDGMCASLGMWFAAASDRTFLSSENSELGSIGALCTLLDFSGMLEQQGLTLHQIYAPQSVDKNKDYRDALNGDYTAIQEDLKQHVASFINHVSTSRPAAAANEKEWNSGKMFRAKDAIKLGLADGVMPFNKAVSYSQFLSRQKNKIQNEPTNNKG